MTLFDSDSQYREKAAIWRIFSLLPLYASLANGRIWRWFAINIPMDMGAGGEFPGDIDILARLNDHPRSDTEIYPAWEVKVGLLATGGIARSLKGGKTPRTLNQLAAYRRFGAPDVSLLDVFLCEAGFLFNDSPPPILLQHVNERFEACRKEGFGYHILPFGHGKDGDVDVGLLAPQLGGPLGRPGRLLLHATRSQPVDPFTGLIARIDAFVASRQRKTRRTVVVFCRECRQLQMLALEAEPACPVCRSDLLSQS